MSSPPQGERTPPRGEDGKSSSNSSSRSRWAAIWLSTASTSVEAPRRKTVCVFAVVVSMMALVKSYLVPVSTVVVVCAGIFVYCRGVHPLPRVSSVEGRVLFRNIHQRQHRLYVCTNRFVLLLWCICKLAWI